MQGKMTMETVEKMMPIFFKTLLEDGQLDRALAVARGDVRERPDHWMPALYLRLKGGRLWNDAPRVLQFIATKERKSAVVPELEEHWQEHVREVSGPTLPDDLAARLGRVELPELLDAVGRRCRQDPDELHRILAGLPAEVYEAAITRFDRP